MISEENGPLKMISNYPSFLVTHCSRQDKENLFEEHILADISLTRILAT